MAVADPGPVAGRAPQRLDGVLQQVRHRRLVARDERGQAQPDERAGLEPGVERARQGLAHLPPGGRGVDADKRLGVVDGGLGGLRLGAHDALPDPHGVGRAVQQRLGRGVAQQVEHPRLGQLVGVQQQLGDPAGRGGGVTEQAGRVRQALLALRPVQQGQQPVGDGRRHRVLRVVADQPHAPEPVQRRGDELGREPGQRPDQVGVGPLEQRDGHGDPLQRRMVAELPAQPLRAGLAVDPPGQVEVEDLVRAGGQDVVQHGAGRRVLARHPGQDDLQRALAGPLQEVVQPAQRPLVAPVDVVDGQQQGTVGEQTDRAAVQLHDHAVGPAGGRGPPPGLAGRRQHLPGRAVFGGRLRLRAHRPEGARPAPGHRREQGRSCRSRARRGRARPAAHPVRAAPRAGRAGPPAPPADRTLTVHRAAPPSASSPSAASSYPRTDSLVLERRPNGAPER
ncbi:hypothetical protein GCM10020218_084200 [Dactylosporangium vinaceum]